MAISPRRVGRQAQSHHLFVVWSCDRPAPGDSLSRDQRVTAAAVTNCNRVHRHVMSPSCNSRHRRRQLPAPRHNDTVCGVRHAPRAHCQFPRALRRPAAIFVVVPVVAQALACKTSPRCCSCQLANSSESCFRPARRVQEAAAAALEAIVRCRVAQWRANPGSA